MPMHLFGSYHIFTKYLPPVNDKVVFIDFGCGPLTSGIAFWAAFAGHRNITYFGIDSSRGMRDKAQDINQYGPYGPNGDESFFTKGWSIRDYNQLPEYLDNYIAAGDQTQIIFNFCYFLASNTLDIRDLSNCLTQVVVKYSQHKMCMIYQNPINSPDSHRNWRTLKGTLSTFRSRYPNQILRILVVIGSDHKKGRLIWRKTGSAIDLYFDILSNKASAPLNDPFELPPIF